MTSYRIRGPHGRICGVQVPGPGVDEQTFQNMIERGEWTIVPEEPDVRPAPRKRAPRKPPAK